MLEYSASDPGFWRYNSHPDELGIPNLATSIMDGAPGRPDTRKMIWGAGTWTAISSGLMGMWKHCATARRQTNSGQRRFPA